MVHTPGPWKVGYNRHVTQENLSACNAQADVGYICSVFNPDGQGDANARLIAAAPDMKEALEEIISLVSPDLYRVAAADRGRMEGVDEAFGKALAVLARVKGAQHDDTTEES